MQKKYNKNSNWMFSMKTARLHPITKSRMTYKGSYISKNKKYCIIALHEFEPISVPYQIWKELELFDKNAIPRQHQSLFYNIENFKNFTMWYRYDGILYFQEKISDAGYDVRAVVSWTHLNPPNKRYVVILDRVEGPLYQTRLSYSSLDSAIDFVKTLQKTTYDRLRGYKPNEQATV